MERHHRSMEALYNRQSVLRKGLLSGGADTCRAFFNTALGSQLIHKPARGVEPTLAQVEHMQGSRGRRYAALGVYNSLDDLTTVARQP